MNLENFIKQFYNEYLARRQFTSGFNAEKDYKQRFFEHFLTSFLNKHIGLLALLDLVQILRYEKDKTNNESFSATTKHLLPKTVEEERIPRFSIQSSSFRARALYLLNKSLSGDPLYIVDFCTLCEHYYEFLNHALLTESISARLTVVEELSELFSISKKHPEYSIDTNSSRQQRVNHVANTLITQALSKDMPVKDRMQVLYQLHWFDHSCSYDEPVSLGVSKTTLQKLYEFLSWVESKTNNKFANNRPPLTCVNLHEFQTAFANLSDQLKYSLRVDVLRSTWAPPQNPGLLILLDFIISGDERLFVDYVKTLLTPVSNSDTNNSLLLSLFLFINGEVDKPYWVNISQDARREIERFLQSSHLIAIPENQVRYVARYWLNTLQQMEPKEQANAHNSLDVEARLSARLEVLEEIVRNQNRILQSLRRKKRR